MKSFYDEMSSLFAVTIEATSFPLPTFILPPFIRSSPPTIHSFIVLLNDLEARLEAPGNGSNRNGESLPL